MKLTLSGALLAILVYNFTVALDERYRTYGDALDYISLGLSVAKTGNYGHLKAPSDHLLKDFRNGKVGIKKYEFDRYTAFRPPIWPFLIAGIFLISGYKLIYIIIFKFLLHLTGVLIFYKTLKLLRIHDIFLVIGTFLYGINPAWQLYSRVFLSEPITFFFITLWLFLLIRYFQNGRGFFLQAIVAGILVLSHPYYLFLPFSVWLVLFLKNKLPFKKLLLSFLLTLCIVSSWIIRNFYTLNTNEIVVTTSSGAVMAKGWNSEIPKNHSNTKGDLADEELILIDFHDTEKYSSGEVQRLQLYKEATLHFIKTNPELILPIIITKIKSAFNPLPETPRPGILETGRWIFHILALLSLLYIIIFSRNSILKSLAIGLFISTITITIITYSGFRFRMPQVALELLLLVFSIKDLMIKSRPLAVES